MSLIVRETTPITFEEYVLLERAAFEKYCLPFFQKFEVALKNGLKLCDFKISMNQESRFPWSLVAQELANRYPNTRVISLEYEPNPEHEIYVDEYTIRFESK